ncbi:MAG: hypothetical protein AB7G37_15260 [Solirubrobacteraceae bacterium]
MLTSPCQNGSPLMNCDKTPPSLTSAPTTDTPKIRTTAGSQRRSRRAKPSGTGGSRHTATPTATIASAAYGSVDG